ncbi:MAG: hypothetical protein R3C19_20475 [Planctomycetaceae bacterium]
MSRRLEGSGLPHCSNGSQARERCGIYLTALCRRDAADSLRCYTLTPDAGPESAGGTAGLANSAAIRYSSIS